MSELDLSGLEVPESNCPGPNSRSDGEEAAVRQVTGKHKSTPMPVVVPFCDGSNRNVRFRDAAR